MYGFTASFQRNSLITSLNPFSAGTDFIRENLTSIDIRLPGFSNTLFHHLHNVAARQKWNESGFMPPLCTYRLNWARRTSWGWWDEWDDSTLQTQDSKFKPWRSEAQHATSRSRRLPTILSFTSGWGRNFFVSFKPPRPEIEPRTLVWKAAVLTTTLGPPPYQHNDIRERDRQRNLFRNIFVALVCFALKNDSPTERVL